MKRNYLFFWKGAQIERWISAFCLFFFLIGITSCQQGLNDDERFSSVSGVTLESPALGENCFVTLTNSDGSESVKVTWPIVYGAGGYLLNINIVDDPSNPIVIITDSIVDGCTTIFSKQEDTKYEISVKALGNEKLNNKEAVSATVYAYSTLIPATTIPEGEDIATYIGANLQFSDKEQGFELIGGKTYLLNGIVDFGLNTITLRGDKSNRPTVILGAGGGFVTQGGLKLKFINFDCTSSTQNGFLCLSDNPSESISNETLGYKAAGATHDCYIVENVVLIQECNFKNVAKSLLYGNKKNWSLRDFRIMDCMVQLNNATSYSVIDLSGASQGLIKETTIKNSTFSNIVANSSGYFLRFSNASNAQPQKIFGSGENSAKFTIEYNTFSHVMSTKDFANNMPNTNTIVMEVNYNILYDVYRLYQFIQTNAVRRTLGNTIYGTWGGTPNSNDTGGRKDTYGNSLATLEDPEFDGPFEVELDLTQENGGVNFTPHGAVAVGNKSGDPRWYE